MISGETQTAIRDGVRAFAQERVRPNAAAYGAAGGYPPELSVKPPGSA